MKSGRIILWIMVCGCLLVVIQQLKIWDRLGGVKVDIIKPPSENHTVERLPYGTYTRTPEGMLVYKEDPEGNMERISGGRANYAPVEHSNVHYDPLTQTYRSADGTVEQTPP